MNVRSFASIKGLVAGCCIAALATACSGHLYHQQQQATWAASKDKIDPNLVEMYVDKLQPMPDSLQTIVALTPMRGANVDTLFKGDDKFFIQYPTDISQSLPEGIDVVYINTDYATPAIADCAILNDATTKDNTKIIIDGSAGNIKKFCKANFNIYHPEANMMVYENLPPDSSPERDMPYGASATMAYGKAYNAISYDMLIESIFDFKMSKKDRIESEEKFKKSFEYEYDPKSPKTIARIAKLNELQKRKQQEQEVRLSATLPGLSDAAPLMYASNSNGGYADFLSDKSAIKMPSSMATKPMMYNTGPYCDWSKWNHDHFNKVWSWDDKVYRSPDDIKKEKGNNISGDERGTHLTNPGWDFYTYTYYRGAFVDGTEWTASYWNTWPLRRLNCIDEAGYYSMRVEKTWGSNLKIDNPKNETVLIGPWIKFSTKTASNGYPDFGRSTSYKKSYGLTRTGGLGITNGGDIMGFSVETTYERNWSKSTSQDIEIAKTSNVEYWFNSCMMKIANPIYGRIEAWTKTKYADGYVSMRLRMIYADQLWGDVKALQYDITDPSMTPHFQGDMRHKNTFWIKAIWKANALRSTPPIKSFLKCGAPIRKGPKY